MRVQKWLVRCWVFALLAAILGAVVLYQRWTDPAVVRLEVMAQLEQEFPGADVTLEAARLRILGGILLTDLRLFRREDESRTDVLYLPSSVIYHDKEKLLDGTLAFRKIEMRRPRLRILRQPNGQWNVLGLIGPADLTRTLPTLVIQEGTILLDDRLATPGLPPLEITDVHLTMINDPLLLVRFEGTGFSTKLGQLELRGTWQRDTNRLDLQWQARDGQVTTTLLQRLAPSCPTSPLNQLELEAQADVQLQMTYDPALPAPLDYDVQIQMRKGKCDHPGLPLACRDLQLTARCRNGQLTLDKLTASAGTTRIEAQGKGFLPCLAKQFEGALVLRNLPLDKGLCSRLPDEVQKLHAMFKASGPLHVRLEGKCESGRWVRKRCILQPESMDICFAYFPYPVEGMAGTLDIDLLREWMLVDLSSCSGTRLISLSGSWHGYGNEADVQLKLQANDVPLDEQLSNALEPTLRELARSFHPSGKADLEAYITHAPGAEQYRNEFHVRFHDARVQWEAFPYALDKVSGFLRIYPTHWEFHDFQGVHKDGRISVRGRSVPNKDSLDDPLHTRIVIDLAGENIGIDADLRQALTPMPTLAKAWDSMGPSGQLNFRATIDRVPGRPQDLDVALNVRGCRIEPAFYRYPLSDLSGQFRLRGNRLELRDLQARHQASNIRVESGKVDLSSAGGYYADLENVQASPLYPQDGFIAALPENLRAMLMTMQLKAPLAIKTRLVIAQSEEPGSLPDVYWDGRAWMQDAQLQLGVGLDKVHGSFACVGRHNGHQLLGLSGNLLLEQLQLFQQPFHNVHAHVQIHPRVPDTLLVSLRAPIFGGDVSGQARVDLHSTLRYEMILNASQIDLQQFGQKNLGENSQWKGLARARLHLTGRGPGVESLDGNGTIDIDDGKLYNLPFLLDLLKFLGLRWPDRTAFEEAHANFSIHGSRLMLNRLDLWGNAISLTGKGGVNLNGTDVDLEFYPSWARMEQLLPPPIRKVSPAVSKSLLKIEVSGKLGNQPEDLQFHKRLVPGIVDPLWQMRERLTQLRRPADDKMTR